MSGQTSGECWVCPQSPLRKSGKFIMIRATIHQGSSMNHNIFVAALALTLPAVWAGTPQTLPSASSTNLLSKAKTSELRRCFRDADQNRKCDRSVKDGGKCKKNCVSPAKAKSTNPALKLTSGKAGEDNTVGNLMLPDCRHGLHFACLGCGACLKG